MKSARDAAPVDAEGTVRARPQGEWDSPRKIGCGMWAAGRAGRTRHGRGPASPGEARRRSLFGKRWTRRRGQDATLCSQTACINRSLCRGCGGASGYGTRRRQFAGTCRTSSAPSSPCGAGRLSKTRIRWKRPTVLSGWRDMGAPEKSPYIPRGAPCAGTSAAPAHPPGERKRPGASLAPGRFVIHPYSCRPLSRARISEAPRTNSVDSVDSVDSV
jgi:hypothetical protein